jgi:hypothetical protein
MIDSLECPRTDSVWAIGIVASSAGRGVAWVGLRIGEREVECMP